MVFVLTNERWLCQSLSHFYFLHDDEFPILFIDLPIQTDDIEKWVLLTGKVSWMEPLTESFESFHAGYCLEVGTRGWMDQSMMLFEGRQMDKPFKAKEVL